jgi:hypothetical protein
MRDVFRVSRLGAACTLGVSAPNVSVSERAVSSVRVSVHGSLAV